MTKRTGLELLIESLNVHGVKTVFHAGGEFPLSGGNLRVVRCGHGGLAALMAEAAAKLTGHPGVCFAVKGSGAGEAALGVHAAMQDSTPLLLLVAQVAADKMGRGALQEIDVRLMFPPPVAKWAVQVENAADISRITRDAFEAATTGRPGPVVLAFPEDVLRAESPEPVRYPQEPLHFAPRHGDIERLRGILNESQKPLAIVGGGGWTDEAIAGFESFCARAALPVAAAFCRQDAFHNSHDSYAGVLGTAPDPQLVKSAGEADTIIAVGTRLGEVTTQGYTLPGPEQKLVHIYPEASELNRVFKAGLAIHSGVAAFAQSVAALELDGSSRAAWTEDLRQRYAAWSAVRSRDKYAVDLDGIAEDLMNALPEDAIVASDKGVFSPWVQRFLSFDRPMRHISSGADISGYAVPAAVAASISRAGRAVVGLMDAPSFLKTGAGVATAVLEKAHPVLLVFNDGALGADIAALARSYGAESAGIARTEDFLPALKDALAVQKTFVMDIRIDRAQAAPGG